MKTLKQLREDRNLVVAVMQALYKKAEDENRGFTSDDDATWSKAEKDIGEIDGKIGRAEKLELITRSLPNAIRVAIDEGKDGPDAEFRAKHRAAFRNLVRSSKERNYVTAEDRTILDQADQRAFAAGTANVGGATVPQDFYPVLDIALKATGCMWASSEIISTDNGRTLPYPTMNYTAVAATIIGEGSAATLDSSTPFGSVSLGAYTYRSPMLPVSIELLDDTAFDESQLIFRPLTESIVRGTNAHFTTGTGTSQPKGIVTAAVSGKVGTTGQTLTVIYDDLVDLVHSVDPAYRTPGDLSYAPNVQSTTEELAKYATKVGFMMKDASVAVVRKLKDSQGMPIWLPSYQVGITAAIPDRLLGYPVWVNQDMATMAANAKSILFGRLDKYKIRRVKDIRLLRLVERYADLLQVGFNMFLRADGNLIDAGTNPVKYYQNSAT
jgi:HK97 family phage major capsid protein